MPSSHPGRDPAPGAARHLRTGKLVAAGVVEGDEIHAVADKVVPGLDGCALSPSALRCAQSPLGQKAGEFRHVGLARHGLVALVIAVAPETREGTERRHLVLEKVVPCLAQIFLAGSMAAAGSSPSCLIFRAASSGSRPGASRTCRSLLTLAAMAASQNRRNCGCRRSRQTSTETWRPGSRHETGQARRGRAGQTKQTT